ncbi:MAG: phosphotransferase [Sedimentisphaerales bacterium]|nr:phosphotransferase [Sedimentisphaerales bacterium]
MPRGGAHFSSNELATVLSHYDIGVIHDLRPLSAGSQRTPKMIVTAERGRFLLKRRPKGKDDLYRAAFAHAVQTHLADRDFPLARLLSTRDEKNTLLQLDNHIYEFFEFITGVRYDGSAEATIDAGLYLAKFHEYLADFAYQPMPPIRGFHDATNVRRHLKTIGTRETARHDSDDVSQRAFEGKEPLKIAEILMTLYNKSSVRVNELGFDSRAGQVVHGDWHPGNMLFWYTRRGATASQREPSPSREKSKLLAVIDFDSVKVAPPITDLANGMLQFSIVGIRPNPADWPDYLDQAKLTQFLNGYLRLGTPYGEQVIRLDKTMLNSLLDLMIETMIAEAVLPIAETGFFGNLTGLDFLKMIRRKAEWIDKNRDKLTEAMQS